MKILSSGVFLFVIVALAVLFGEGNALAQWGGGPGMMPWGYGMGWFWGVLMFAFWFAGMVVLILLIRWLALSVGTKSRETKSEPSAMDILKKRYAQGEISKEEFEEKKKALES